MPHIMYIVRVRFLNLKFIRVVDPDPVGSASFGGFGSGSASRRVDLDLFCFHLNKPNTINDDPMIQ